MGLFTSNALLTIAAVCIWMMIANIQTRLKTIETKLDLDITRQSVVRMEQLCRMRDTYAAKGDTEMLELLDTLIDDEIHFGSRNKTIDEANKRIVKE